MANVILYSTGCPQCKALKAMLDKKHIQYEVCSDVETMTGLGIQSVPMLGVDNELLKMKDAFSWAKGVE